MTQRLFTSDTHFGHEFMARGEYITRTGTKRTGIRGFDSIEEHDEWLIKQWNSVVNRDDTVYHLGDFSLRAPDKYGNWLPRLNGIIHLIWGNHDKGFNGQRDAHRWVKPYLDAGFASVASFGKVKIAGIQFLMSHFPYEGDHTGDERYEQYRLRDCGLPIIHGHTHDKAIFSTTKAGTCQLHIGIEAAHKPVTETEIIFLYEKWVKEYALVSNTPGS